MPNRRNFYKVRPPSMHKRQANADKADDHNGDSAKPGPPNIVMGALLLEPLRFNLITRPTKRRLRIAEGYVVIVECVSRVSAFELGSPCGLYLWLSHFSCSLSSAHAKKRASAFS
jgi:hypothetical protein